VNDQFVLADLPGYGYARVSKARQAEWRPLLEGYIAKTPQLAGVVQLLDMRREPSEDDAAMLDLLAELGMPTIVVLTKSDKLSRKASAERAESIARSLLLDPDQTISFSAMTGEGRDELAGAIMAAVSAATHE
jgi:GTP-binding protein